MLTSFPWTVLPAMCPFKCRFWLYTGEEVRAFRSRINIKVKIWAWERCHVSLSRAVWVQFKYAEPFIYKLPCTPRGKTLPKSDLYTYWGHNTKLEVKEIKCSDSTETDRVSTHNPLELMINVIERAYLRTVHISFHSSGTKCTMKTWNNICTANNTLSHVSHNALWITPRPIYAFYILAELW